MKREYSAQLNSLIVVKSRTFIGSFDELFEKLYRITPGTRANIQTIHILKSLNDTKLNAILAKTVKYVNVLAFMAEKLNDILDERAVFISGTGEIDLCMKVYPEINLKSTEVEIQNANVRSRTFLYPISKKSLKFEKLYQT